MGMWPIYMVNLVIVPEHVAQCVALICGHVAQCTWILICDVLEHVAHCVALICGYVAQSIWVDQRGAGACGSVTCVLFCHDARFTSPGSVVTNVCKGLAL